MNKENNESESIEPEVYYIPGAKNRYFHNRNQIILDSRLKEQYSLAHDYILEHERQHQNETIIEFIIHEFRSDLRLNFSTTAEISEMRKYVISKSPKNRMSFHQRVGRSFAKILRVIWLMLMLIPGYIYRRWVV